MSKRRSKSSKVKTKKKKSNEWIVRSRASKRGWQTRKANAKKRSNAAKKGWETRRARKVLSKPKKQRSKRHQQAVDAGFHPKVPKRGRRKPHSTEVQKLSQRIAELERQLSKEKEKQKNEEEIENLMGRFRMFTMIEKLPPQRINESRDEWAFRIINTLVKEGIYSIEAGYRAVSRHTGMPVGEVYSMWTYVSMGEYVA